jgi:hypothetical protein
MTYLPPHQPPPYGSYPPPGSPYGYGIAPPSPYYAGAYPQSPGSFPASGPGIASCVVGGLGLLSALFAAAVMVGAHGQSRNGPPTTDDYVLGLGMLAGCGGGGTLGLIGLVLGIIGVAMPNRRKTGAVIGLVLSAAALVAIAGAMAVTA